MNDFLPDETIPAHGLTLTLPPQAAEAAKPGEVVQGALGFSQAAKLVVTSGRFGLCILSHELDASLYGTPTFVEAVKLLVLAQRQSKVRILLTEPNSRQKTAQALVELARIVSSRIELREVSLRRPTDVAELVIADGRVHVERRGSQDVQAYYFAHAPLMAQERQRLFDRLWEQAVPSTELRRLSI